MRMCVCAKARNASEMENERNIRKRKWRQVSTLWSGFSFKTELHNCTHTEWTCYTSKRTRQSRRIQFSRTLQCGFPHLKGNFFTQKFNFPSFFPRCCCSLFVSILYSWLLLPLHTQCCFFFFFCALLRLFFLSFSLSLLMMVVAVVFVARVKVSTQRKPAVEVFERILHKTANLYFSCSRNIVTQFSFWSSSRSLQNVVHILGILFFFPFQCARNLHEFRNRLFGFSFSYSRGVLTRRRNSNSLSCGQ